MKEIVQVNLDNEMDLILAHKRSMKMVELCGMSHTVQTTFATAVSEVTRGVMGKDKNALLHLGIGNLPGNRKELVARISFDGALPANFTSAMKYAKRLVNEVVVIEGDNEMNVVLKQGLNYSGLLNDARIQGFVNYFKNELPVSAYDELRKKNIQLIELSEKLKQSEDQYRTLTDTLPLMLFTTNSGGFINFANKRLKDFFGNPEVDNGKLLWTSLVNIHDSSHLRSDWVSSQESASVFRYQGRLNAVKTEEQQYWHLISLVPTKSEGHLSGWTGFFVDIHAQKLMEETMKHNRDLKNAQKQLLQSQSKLEEKISELNKSNHDLEQFAYIASHDLQEPLRKIRSFAELLNKNIHDGEKREKYLAKIDESSLRMSTLIKDVLDYSRLTKSSSSFETVDLNHVILAVKTDMELMIEEKKASVESKDLPVISGMKQQLFQLFYNLVSNALKFTEKNPRITISCIAAPEQSLKLHGLNHGSKYVQVTVEDNGIGFDQKYAQQIFTIFKRLNNRESYSGTGIGLALCKKIVDNHHGAIEAESKPGEGATFRIILPVD